MLWNRKMKLRGKKQFSSLPDLVKIQKLVSDLEDCEFILLLSEILNTLLWEDPCLQWAFSFYFNFLKL